MTKFEEYLKKLITHEYEQSGLVDNPQRELLVVAGERINGLGAYLGNPKIKWELQEIQVETILFSGTSPEWNEILIKQCNKSVNTLKDLLEIDPNIRTILEAKASFSGEPILLRETKEGDLTVMDGMHRFVGAILEGKDMMQAFVPVNQNAHKPVCEPHVVYDLLWAYTRDKNEKGLDDLYHGLRLLAVSYENIPELLETKLTDRHIGHHPKALQVIQRILQEIKS